MQTKPDVRVWKAEDLNYVPVGTGGMRFCNPIDSSIGQFDAGFLDVHSGTLKWTERGDEFIWVLAGRIEITHGDEAYHLDPGDFIFMKDGISLTMTGSEDARIAYIGHLHCQ